MLLRQLRYFTSIARAGSFVAASRELNVSQPALGYQVKKLEERLGTELLVRLPRGVALTQAGQELLKHATVINEQVNEAIAAVAACHTDPRRQFSFGATPTAGKALVPDLLAQCGAERGLQITIREALSSELLNDVQAGRLDVALCYDPPPQKGIAAFPLYREDLFLVGPPALIGCDPSEIAFAELAHFPLVLDTGSQITRGMIERIAKEHGVRLNVTVEVEPAGFKRELLTAERCCTLVPLGLFLHEIVNHELACRHVVAPSISRVLTLIARAGLPGNDIDFIRALLAPIVARKIDDGRLGWKEL